MRVTRLLKPSGQRVANSLRDRLCKLGAHDGGQRLQVRGQHQLKGLAQTLLERVFHDLKDSLNHHLLKFC